MLMKNPDIVPLSAIVQCRVDVDQQQQRGKHIQKDGENCKLSATGI